MSRKLYKITTTLEEHSDFTARLKKRTNEIYSFFGFNQGDVENMKKTYLIGLLVNILWIYVKKMDC